jgi:hypothetical protein
MKNPNPHKDQTRDIRQVVGADMGWPLRYTLLIDLAALAGFIWALFVTYQIWRKRRT